MACTVVFLSFGHLTAPVTQYINEFFIKLLLIFSLNNKGPVESPAQVFCHIPATMVEMGPCRFCNEFSIGIFIARLNNDLLFLKRNPRINTETMKEKPVLCPAFIHEFNLNCIPLPDPYLRTGDCPVISPDHCLVSIKIYLPFSYCKNEFLYLSRN